MTSTSLPAASTSPQVMASLIGALAVLILGAVIAFSALAAPAVPLSPTQSDENWVIQNMGGYQEFVP